MSTKEACDLSVLHVCPDYLGTRLYFNLFESLSTLVKKQFVYVPVAFNTIISEMPQYVLVSPCFNKWDRLVFHYKQSKVLLDIKRKIDIDGYDIVHAHFLFSGGYAAYRLHKKHGIPYVAAVRNTDVNLFFRRMPHLRHLGRKILEHASRVLFLSESYKNELLTRYLPELLMEKIQVKSLVIPNGINSFWLDNKYLNRKEPENKTIKLICVCNVDKNKNIEATIQACEILITQGYNVSFNVVGNILEPQYELLIKNTRFVTHTPYCGQDEVINHLRMADIFVMPSKTETFGLVYAEAMSQGLPVIYTKGQGFDGHFPDGEAGYAVSCSSPKEIVERVVSIYGDYGRISNNCVRLADCFDWAVLTESYTALYKEVLYP